jgi:hypothetical protein
MSVDVEIYMNNITKFFKENPKELYNLIPEKKEKEFYDKVRNAAISNEEKGNEISLTQKQLLDICAELHGKSKVSPKVIRAIMVKTEFGYYSLN